MHGIAVESVHFHEVGAIDAIIDIVGVCAGLDALGIDATLRRAAAAGPGWTQSAHGRIPLPAPATLNCWPRPTRRPDRRPAPASWSRRPARR